MSQDVRVRVSPSAPRLGYSQVGKAAGFDPAIHRFESCYPSQILEKPLIERLFIEDKSLGYVAQLVRAHHS